MKYFTINTESDIIHKDLYGDKRRVKHRKIVSDNMVDDDVCIADNVKKAVKEYDISISELSDYMGLTTRETKKLLNNEYPITLTVFEKLCNLFGEDYLWGKTSESDYKFIDNSGGE